MENELINDNEHCLNFSFDKLDLLGVFGNYIFIKGEMDYNYENPVILKIKKLLFFKIQKEWIKEKQYYCEHFKGFCGVNNTSSSDFIEDGETEIYDFDSYENLETELKTIKVKIYLINSLDTECEHG
jgi:hypothetical protein